MLFRERGEDHEQESARRRRDREAPEAVVAERRHVGRCTGLEIDRRDAVDAADRAEDAPQDAGRIEVDAGEADAGDAERADGRRQTRVGVEGHEVVIGMIRDPVQDAVAKREAGDGLAGRADVGRLARGGLERIERFVELVRHPQVPRVVPGQSDSDGRADSDGTHERARAGRDVDREEISRRRVDAVQRAGLRLERQPQHLPESRRADRVLLARHEVDRIELAVAQPAHGEPDQRRLGRQGSDAEHERRDERRATVPASA